MRATYRRVTFPAILTLLLVILVSPVMGATGLSIPSRSLETAAPAYGLKASVNGGEVALEWSGIPVPAGKQLRGYHVFRSGTQTDLLSQSDQVTEFAITGTSFSDHVIAGLYYYAVQATYTDGTRGTASQPLEVNATTASKVLSPRSTVQPSVLTEIITPQSPIILGGETKIIENIGTIPKVQEPIPVAFSAVANRYTGVDPATIFDLNGDLIGDLKVSSTEVSVQNGAGVQLLDPPALNLDQVHLVPAAGYSQQAPLQLSRVYVAQLPEGGYAKLMILQASPKVTIWFMYGAPTSSVLQADGANSHAVLTWDALPDAALGYNVYRFDVNDNSYTVTQLNDFTVQETNFTDNTAANRYYLYVVQAMKAGGSPGSLTTTVAVFVTHQVHNLVAGLTAGSAKLDGASVSMPVQAEIRNGLMMVPASLLTYTGTKVTYEAGSGKIILSRRLESVTYTVAMNVDSPDYTWNGTAYKTDVQPYKNGIEAMVPLRVVAPVLGLGVTFNSTDRTANIGWYD